MDFGSWFVPEEGTSARAVDYCARNRLVRYTQIDGVDYFKLSGSGHKKFLKFAKSENPEDKEIFKFLYYLKNQLEGRDAENKRKREIKDIQSRIEEQSARVEEDEAKAKE